jgi:hypothetical protein
VYADARCGFLCSETARVRYDAEVVTAVHLHRLTAHFVDVLDTRAKALPESLLRRLYRRDTDRQAGGRTGLVLGDTETFGAIAREARYRKLRTTVAIVQPGLSNKRISEDIRAQLGATERFLSDTYDTRLRVLASI